MPQQENKEQTNQNHTGIGHNIKKIEVSGSASVDMSIDLRHQTIFFDKKPIIKYIPSSIRSFTGREEELKKLNQHLNEQQVVLLLNGLGGIGKTTVAMEYVKRNGDKYKSIIWLDFKDTFTESFFKFNAFFEITGKEEEVYQKIVAELSHYEGNNLLIIDNFTNQNEVKELQYLLPNFKKLITSREEIKNDFVMRMCLDELPPEEAEALFRKHYNKDYDRKRLRELFELISYHTLTIELVAKTLNLPAPACTLDDIYKIFKDKTFDTLKGTETVQLNYKDRQTQINTYLEEIFSIANLNETQLRILQNFAVLPPIEIDETVVIDLLGGDKDDSSILRKNLRELLNSGWLSRTDRGIKCHRIIQQLIAKDKKTDFDAVKNVVIYVGNKLHFEPSENPLHKVGWIGYGVSLLNNLSEKNNDIATLANNLALIYRNLGDLKNALVYAEKDLKISEKVLPKDHPDLATSYSNLALIYYNLGDLKNAKIYTEKALKIREQVLPKDHPDLAQSYNNLAAIYRDLGDLKNALNYNKKALKIYELVLPKDHPDRATSYNNLAMIYKDLGDLKNALNYNKKALKIREQVLPKGHRDLAASYNNLALIYQALGDFKNALVYSGKALKITEQVLPKDHPDLASSYNNLATIYRDLGDLKNARVFTEKALAIFKKVLPQGHPSIMTVEGNLALIMKDIEKKGGI